MSDDFMAQFEVDFDEAIPSLRKAIAKAAAIAFVQMVRDALVSFRLARREGTSDTHVVVEIALTDLGYRNEIEIEGDDVPQASSTLRELVVDFLEDDYDLAPLEKELRACLKLIESANERREP